MNMRFSNVGAAHSPIEQKALTTSVLKHGCLIPLVIWKDMLIDGHERLKICKEHGIPFETTEVRFEDDSEAITWILKHQLATRNLFPFQRCMMIFKNERNMKVIRDWHGCADGFLSSMACVSRDTFTKARRIWEDGDEETLNLAFLSINYAYDYLLNRHSNIANIDEAVKRLIERIEEGKTDNLQQELKKLSRMIEKKINYEHKI